MLLRQGKRPPPWTDSRTWASTRVPTSSASTKLGKEKVSPAGRTCPTNLDTCRATRIRTLTTKATSLESLAPAMSSTLCCPVHALHAKRACSRLVPVAGVLPGVAARWTIPLTIKTRRRGTTYPSTIVRWLTSMISRQMSRGYRKIRGLTRCKRYSELSRILRWPFSRDVDCPDLRWDGLKHSRKCLCFSSALENAIWSPHGNYICKLEGTWWWY